MSLSSTSPHMPSSSQLEQLPSFQSLPPSKIHLIQTLAECQHYAHELSIAAVLGFDSESKPIFKSGEVSDGPHLIQLATLDRAYLFRKKGVELNSVLELSKCFHSFGLKNPVGLKHAMALLFQVYFPKSKRLSTSNWANPVLSTAQIEYAAADAYAPVLVFEELLRLGLLPKQIPNTSLNLRIRPSKTPP